MTDNQNDSNTPSSSSTTSNKRKQEWFGDDPERNPYVYVTGLPKTLTEEEFIELMKRYGIIARKTTIGFPPHVKLYKNEDGSFKGDALCKYVRKESVELALTHLDGYHYDDKHVIHCERAKFEMKGEYDPAKKARIDKETKLRQRKVVQKLLSWESEVPLEVTQTKVILKHMFTPEELLEDASLLLDLREDVELKCKEISAIPKRVDIYDRHPDGVIAVTFQEPQQARACVNLLNNQFYAGRVVIAELWDGRTRYKIKETEEEEEARLEKWKEDLQDSSDDEDNGTKKEESEPEKEFSGTKDD